MKRGQWYWLGGSLLLLGLVKLALVGWYLHKTPASAPVEHVVCPAQSAVCPLPDGVHLRFIDPPNEKQAFTLALEGVVAEPSAEFSMRSMDMGFNRYRFVRAHDRWEARVTLPACVSGRHDWLMTLNYNGRRVQLPLPIHP
jgi:hypothetical protein